MKNGFKTIKYLQPKPFSGKPPPENINTGLDTEIRLYKVCDGDNTEQGESS